MKRGSHGARPSASCSVRKISGAPRIVEVPGGVGSTLGSEKMNISGPKARSSIALTRSPMAMRSRLVSLAMALSMSDSRVAAGSVRGPFGRGAVWAFGRHEAAHSGCAAGMPATAK